MGITVAVRVEHLRTASAPVASPAGDKFRTILVPNLDYYGTVRATLNAFIRQNLFIPEDLQLLSAPLFTRLSEKDNVEDIYKRYSCQVLQKLFWASGFRCSAIRFDERADKATATVILANSKS